MGNATAEELRQTIHQTWETIAHTWAGRREQIESTCAPVRDWIVHNLGTQPSDTVLELAAGVGETGFQLAAYLGDRGRLISSDFSEAMLEELRKRGAERGLGNVEYRSIDAERIELEDDSVDRVICRFGYMLMADCAGAMTETRRVLRPGGRLALAVWAAPERNPFFTALAMTLVRRGHIPPPDPDAPGIFRLGSPQKLESMLTSAGFGNVRIEEVPVRFEVPAIDEYLGFAKDTAGPLAIALRALPQAEIDAIRADIESAFEPYAVSGGYDIPGMTLCAVAS